MGRGRARIGGQMGLGAYAAMFATALAVVLGASAAGPVERAAACVITVPANVTMAAPKLFFAQVRNGRLTFVVSTAASARIDLARCLNRKCSKTKPATNLSAAAVEGTNRVKLPTKAGGKALPAAVYLATVVATGSGGSSTPLVARYRVK